MRFKVGDRVRIETGIEGKIALFNADGVTAYIRLDGDQPGTTFTLCHLDALAKIDGVNTSYTAKAK